MESNNNDRYQYSFQPNLNPNQNINQSVNQDTSVNQNNYNQNQNTNNNNQNSPFVNNQNLNYIQTQSNSNDFQNFQYQPISNQQLNEQFYQQSPTTSQPLYQHQHHQPIPHQLSQQYQQVPYQNHQQPFHVANNILGTLIDNPIVMNSIPSSRSGQFSDVNIEQQHNNLPIHNSQQYYGQNLTSSQNILQNSSSISENININDIKSLNQINVEQSRHPNERSNQIYMPDQIPIHDQTPNPNQNLVPDQTSIPDQISIPDLALIDEQNLKSEQNNIESNDSKSDFTINNLLLTSDFFLNKAHEIVLDSNDIIGTKNYYKMIKISIKSLLILIKQYSQCLNPKLELIIYFKLAKIYLNETENLNRADDYINKAISISSRNNLIKIQFVSEFLAGKILERTNSKLFLNYINERITNYTNKGFENLCGLLTLSKINNLLISDCSTGLIILQSLTKNFNIDKSILILALFYQCNMHLYRGSPNYCEQGLEQIELTLQNISNIQPQIIAMKLLLSLQLSIQTNQIEKSKLLLKQISDFVTLQRNNNWDQWNENGAFIIETKISDKNENDTLPYQVSWLNSDEFVILFYTLTGIHLLSEMQHFKRADKVFKACLKLIDNQLCELTKVKESKRNFPLYQLTNKIVRLNYTKYCINYYQVWLKFTNNDFDISGLNGFINNYNSNNFTTEELCYYKLLLPRIFYLFGIFCQFKGDLKSAKFYYLKVRNFTGINTKKNDDRISALQLSLGVGGESFQSKFEFNELYTYSTFHLLLITTYELRKIPKSSPNVISKSHDFLNLLYKDLTNAVSFANKLTSNSFTMNFVNSNQLFLISYKVVLAINSSNGFQHNSPLNDLLNKQLIELDDQFRIPSGMTFINSLVLYVIYLGSINLDERDKYFKLCIELISDTKTDNDKVLQIFILNEMYQDELKKGNEDNARIMHFKVQALRQELNNKFETANLISQS